MQRLPDTTARARPENIAILLREPFVAANDVLLGELRKSGHAEVRAPHGAVFQYLDDGGTRVAELAARAQVTKQSMSELVAHLERHNYVERVADPDDGRAKLVRTTARGREVYAIARQVVADVEADWATKLGARRFSELRGLLEDLNAKI